MNDEVRELLSHYKKEKELIDLQIKEDLMDYDYQAAHLDALIMAKIERKIRLLEHLIDPNANQREMLMWRLSNLPKISNQDLTYYQESVIRQVNSQLELLNHYKPGYFNDGQEFDDAVFDLVENKISGFIFSLKKSVSLSLLFKKHDAEILVFISGVKKLKEEYNLNKSIRSELKSIGFRKNKQLDAYVFRYDTTKFRDAIFIKTIVSRVIFDAFHFQDLDQETNLCILP